MEQFAHQTRENLALWQARAAELAADPEDVTCVGMFTQRPGLSSELAKGAQLPLVIRPYVRA